MRVMIMKVAMLPHISAQYELTSSIRPLVAPKHFSNKPSLEALIVQNRTITGRYDFCERVNLLKALRRAWAWTNDAFEMIRDKLILLPPREINDLYGVAALEGGAGMFDERFGVKSRGVKK
jgi:hypothetical protein